MIRVWRCWIVRPKAFLLVSHGMLWTAILSSALLGYSNHSFPVVLHNKLGLIFLLLALQICFYFNNLDALIVGPNSRLFLAKAVASIGMGMLLTVPLFLLFPNLFPGYGWALSTVMLSALVLLGLRPLLPWLIKRKQFVEGLLILGSGDLAKKFYDELASGRATQSENSPHASALVQTQYAEHTEYPGVMINYDQLREITLRDGISRIVVADANAQSSARLSAALLDCKLRGLEVEQAIESYEKLSGRIWIEALRPEWLVYSEGFQPPRYYRPLKRIFDTIIAAVLLLLTAPLMAIIALMIKRDSNGPVLFRQVRVGRNDKEFVLFKFRTMRQDAEQTTGPIWSDEGDPRVTRIGRFLRRFRLDELPQAFNVLRGEMSLIGPRPERPHFVKLLTESIPYYGLRHCIKPGITGWAQVLYPYGASVEDSYEKLQYDLYYAKHMSLVFDLRILLGTIKVVFFGRGR